MKKKENRITNSLIITILHLLFFTVLGNAELASMPNAKAIDSFSYRFNPEDSIKKEKGKKEKGKKDKLEDRTKSIKNKKAVTFETFEKNYNRAMRFYENQQYLSAARLFEELYPLTMGTAYGDTILFTFAHCYYLNRDYELATIHFKDYSRRYAGTPKAEEAYFLCLKSLYNLSPVYSLDQFETKYAIEEIGFFIQEYPRSIHMEECNKMLDQLREKLALKDFEITKLYYYTERYEAVQIYVKSFMKEYASSELVPELYFLLTKSNFEYAKKSVEAKQVERYMQCMDAYETLKANHPASPYVVQAAKYANDAQKAIEKIHAKK